jgi:single-strand DNA-binding protein
VIIAGRLTRDPELKYTTSGKPYCKISVANSRRFRARDGAEWQEETTFVEVTIWGPYAESVGQKLGKGRPVLVEGRLRTSEWEDKATGQKRSRLEINAERVTPLDWDEKPGGGNRGEGGGQQRSYGGGGGQSQPAAARNYSPVDDEPIPEDDIPF